MSSERLNQSISYMDLSQRKRKGADESLDLTSDSHKRIKNKKDLVVIDTHFSELILPLFQSRGWRYDSKSNQICKDRDRLDCVYTSTCIQSNPIWINTLVQIRNQDQEEPNQAAFLDFLVSEIADRIILTKQQQDRIDYQAFVENHSEISESWESTTPVHESDTLSSTTIRSIARDTLATGAINTNQETLSTTEKTNLDLNTVSLVQKCKITEAGNEVPTGMNNLDRLPQDDTFHSSIDVDETKDLDLVDDDPMFAIPSSSSSPSSASPLVFQNGNDDFDELMDNIETEKPSIPILEETHDLLPENQQEKKILDKRLVEVTDSNKMLFVKARKRLPKMIHNDFSESKPWCINVDQLLERVWSEMSIESITSSNRSDLISAQVQDCKRDPLTQILSVQGRRDIVEIVNTLVTKDILRSMAEYNCMDILEDPKSVICNINLEISKDLGFTLAGAIKNKVGLWLKNIERDKQLGRILGRSAEKGVVLLSIEGQRMTKPSDKKKVIDEGLSRSDKNLSFKFCLHKDLDPKTVKIDRILKNENGVYFERIDGSLIELQLNIMKNSDTASVSDDRECNSEALGVSKLVDFHQFRDKIKDARDLEFTVAGSKYRNKITSSMWHRHKALFGDICGQDCPCLNNLTALIKNVTRDCSELDAQQVLQERSGFIGSFVGKFSSKIQKQYPSYSSQEVLKKLFGMWRVHQSQPRFGLSCTKECECGEIWAQMIQPSELDSGSKKTLMLKSIAKKSVAETVDKLSLTFPCHKPLGFYVTTVAAESFDQSRCVIASIAPSLQNKMLRVGAIVTKAASLNSDRITVLHSHSQLKEFYHAAKISHSKITLWFDISQSQDELNDLSSNWTANSAWLQDESDGWAGGSPLAGSSPEKPVPDDDRPTHLSDLRNSVHRKHLYDLVTKKNAQLNSGADKKINTRGVFSQSQFYNHRTDRQLTSNRSFSTSLGSTPHNRIQAIGSKESLDNRGDNGQKSIDAINHFRGSINLSADIMSARNISSSLGPFPENRLLTERENKAAANAIDSLTPFRDREISFKDTSLNDVSASLPRPKSLKRVHFANENILCQFRFIPPRGSSDLSHEEFLPSSATGDDSETRCNIINKETAPNDNDIPVKRRIAATIDNDIPVKKRRAMRLLRSIDEGTVCDMICALNDGFKRNDPINGDKTVSAYLKERLKDTQIDAVTRALLYFKNQVFRIWSTAIYAIDIARYLDESKCMQFSPVCAHGIELSSTCQTAGLSQLVTCTSLQTYTIEGEGKPISLPSLPFQSSIDWTTTGNQFFSVCYNSHIDRYKDLSGKKLVIKLEMGNSEKKVELGRWEEYIDVIECRLNEKSRAMCPEIRRDMTTSVYMTKGVMVVKFQRATCPEGYIAKKKKEADNLLWDVSKWLYQAQKNCTEDINIASMMTSGHDQVNLLHAAVYLRDIPLVNHFLHLGCNFEIKGKDIGTPLDLASNLADKAKLRCDRDTENQFREIIRVLKDARLALSRPTVIENVTAAPEECDHDSDDNKITHTAEETNLIDHGSLYDFDNGACADGNIPDVYDGSTSLSTQADVLQADILQPSLEISTDKIYCNHQFEKVLSPPVSSLLVQDKYRNVTVDAAYLQNQNDYDGQPPSPVSVSDEEKHEERRGSERDCDSPDQELGLISHECLSFSDRHHTDDPERDTLSDKSQHEIDINRRTLSHEEKSSSDVVGIGVNDILNISGQSLGIVTDVNIRLSETVPSSAEDQYIEGENVDAGREEDSEQVSKMSSSINQIDKISTSHPIIVQTMPSSIGRGRTSPSRMAQKDSSYDLLEPTKCDENLSSNNMQREDEAIRSLTKNLSEKVPVEFENVNNDKEIETENSAEISSLIKTVSRTSPLHRHTEQQRPMSMGRGRDRTIPSWMAQRKAVYDLTSDRSLEETSTLPSDIDSLKRISEPSKITPRVDDRGNETNTEMTSRWIRPIADRIPPSQNKKPVSDERSESTSNSDYQRHNEKGHIICDFFGTITGCKRGYDCPFRHIVARAPRSYELNDELSSRWDRPMPDRKYPPQNNISDNAWAENRHEGRSSISDERSESTSNSDYHRHEVCRFFGTAHGCKKGFHCEFRHVHESELHNNTPSMKYNRSKTI